MQKYRDVIQDRAGNRISGALVRVQTYPGAVDATIYSDDGSTEADNPLTTDARGEFEFYAADGSYQFVITNTGFTSRTITDIQLEDVEDASAGVFTTISVSGASTLSGAVSIGSTLSVTGAATFSGQILAADGSAAAPAYAFSGATGTGISRSGGNLLFGVAGTQYAQINGRFDLASTVELTWLDAPLASATVADVKLARDAANILAQRNGTSAQAFRVYNTFTDASNYERASVGWQANVFEIGVSGAGTGSNRSILLSSGAGGNFAVGNNAPANWGITTSGHLVAVDNTYDIGASGGTRPRSIYWGTQALGPNGSAATPAYSFVNDTDSGMYTNGADVLQWATAGELRMQLDSNGVLNVGNGSTTGVNLGGLGGTPSLLLSEAAYTVALRNGVNAQAVHVYGTFTDASNYERVRLAADSGGAYLYAQNAGTGGARNLYLGTQGTGRWLVESIGNLLTVADNTYDIGASGANRPRTAYFGTSVYVGGNASIGLGGITTVSPWSGIAAIELSNLNTTNGYVGGSGNGLYVGGNAYWDGASWKHRGTGAATRLFCTLSNYQFDTAPSAAGGAAAAFSTQFIVEHVASAVNYLQVGGAVTTGGPHLIAQGSDSDVSIYYGTKGAGGHQFYTNWGGAYLQFVISHRVSAVNYWEFLGGQTGQDLVVQASGSDANVGMQYYSKGTSGHRFFTNLLSEQFRVAHTASAVNYAQISGGATGNPVVLEAQGSDTNIIAILRGKGTGGVYLGAANFEVTQAGSVIIPGASMVQRSISASETLVAADANKHILHPAADNNARTFTIPANSSVAYAIGTALTFINEINVLSIAITTDTLTDTDGNTGTRTLAANGIATAVKVSATSWRISGAGLT